ncbi:hypothetical protein H632_c33p3 [Helicosporidium sp. ATCC 50920]|nr:hypothetical protein H632_c33p3 [Helicosporidium sp. ATCC 50920]|eukprot:KDD77044.1 hypothetical protein H632_c33p3 [Helicosporidium sp. ATCC 50920]
MVGAEDGDREKSVFAEAKVLTLSELDIFFERSLRARREADPEYTPNLLLGKAMEYARHFATNHSQESATKIRQVLAESLMTEAELGSVANLAPRTAEEARALIPSLTEDRFSDEQLNAVLQEVEALRAFE